MNDSTDENSVYLTKEGHRKLQDEYNELRYTKIPVIATRIEEARQQGDLSENAEYHVAREEMAWAQTRLAELEATLRNVKVIVAAADEVVHIGSTVEVETGGKVKTFRIVGVQESNPAAGLISHESPLAQALLGHAIGETVEVSMPQGTVQYRILKIE